MSEKSSEPQLIDVLKLISCDATELEPLIADLNNTLDSIYPPHWEQNASNVNNKYNNVILLIDRVINQSKQALSLIDSSIEIKNIEKVAEEVKYEEKVEVSENKIEHSGLEIGKSAAQTTKTSKTKQAKQKQANAPGTRMFNAFLNRDLQPVPPPYPPLCGAIPSNQDTSIDIYDYVAVFNNDQYLLCYISDYDGVNFTVVDADTEKQPFKRKRSDITPLPLYTPIKPDPKAEFPAGKKVLALYPNDSDNWTSIFYPAKVLKPPSKFKKEFYSLEFDNDSETGALKIPEKFVVRIPE